MKSIVVKDLKNKLLKNKNIIVFDIRSPLEIEHAPFEIIGDNKMLFIPMDQVPARMEEIPKTKDLYIICRSGVRSRYVGEYLEDMGYPETTNVEGGIIAWQDEVLNK